MESFYLFVPPDRVLGPHRFENLQEWLAMGAISTDTQVCPEGSETWSYLADFPGYDELSKKIQAKARQRDTCEDQASMEELEKLGFFSIPFAQMGLTKTRAAMLLDYFAAIDPLRETAYQALKAIQAQAAMTSALEVLPEAVDREKASGPPQGKITTRAKGAWIGEDYFSSYTFRAELWMGAFGEGGHASFDFKKPAKTKVKIVLALLDETNPGWEKLPRAEHQQMFFTKLAEKFPELCKSTGDYAMYHPVKGIHY